MKKAVFLLFLFMGAGVFTSCAQAGDETSEVITIEGNLPEGEEYRQKFQDKLDGTLQRTKESQQEIRKQEEKDRLDQIRKKQTNKF